MGGLNILFFKVAFDAFFLQLPDGGQAVDGIAGKAADGLGDDEIDFPGQRISHHGLEALAVLGAGTGDALIRVAVLSGTFFWSIILPF